MSDVHDEASVCPQCNARKGFGFKKRGFDRDGGGYRAGAVFFTALAVAAVVFPVFVPVGFVSGTIFGATFALVAYVNWRIWKRGPRWYR